MAKKRKYPSKKKAKKILKEGVAKGKKLTKAQRSFFGWVSGGKKPRKRTKK